MNKPISETDDDRYFHATFWRFRFAILFFLGVAVGLGSYGLWQRNRVDDSKVSRHAVNGQYKKISLDGDLVTPRATFEIPIGWYAANFVGNKSRSYSKDATDNLYSDMDYPSFSIGPDPLIFDTSSLDFQIDVNFSDELSAKELTPRLDTDLNPGETKTAGMVGGERAEIYGSPSKIYLVTLNSTTVTIHVRGSENDLGPELQHFLDTLTLTY